MIETMLLATFTSEFTLWLCAATAVVAIIGRLFGLFPEPWHTVAKLLTPVLLAAVFFLIGYRLADDHAAMQTRLDKLEADKLQLQSQLAIQVVIARGAAADRDRIAADKVSSDQKVADYEEQLRNAPAVTRDTCVIDDADLRFRDSLRRKRRRP